MKAFPSFALSAALILAAGSACAFSLEDAAQAASAMSGGGAGSDAGGAGALANPQTLNLINALGALNVTPQQAVGGTGALLGLAQNRLAGNQYSQLTGAVPGLEMLTGNNGLSQLGALSGLLGGGAQAPLSQQSGALLGNVNSMQDVNQAFSSLGMAPSLVGQFAPILLQFLGNQGVASTLLQSLGGVWGVPGALAPVGGVSAPVGAGGGY